MMKMNDNYEACKSRTSCTMVYEDLFKYISGEVVSTITEKILLRFIVSESGAPVIIMAYKIGAVIGSLILADCVLCFLPNSVVGNMFWLNLLKYNTALAIYKKLEEMEKGLGKMEKDQGLLLNVRERVGSLYDRVYSSLPRDIHGNVKSIRIIKNNINIEGYNNKIRGLGNIKIKDIIISATNLFEIYGANELVTRYYSDYKNEYDHEGKLIKRTLYELDKADIIMVFSYDKFDQINQEVWRGGSGETKYFLIEVTPIENGFIREEFNHDGEILFTRYHLFEGNGKFVVKSKRSNKGKFGSDEFIYNKENNLTKITSISQKKVVSSVTYDYFDENATISANYCNYDIDYYCFDQVARHNGKRNIVGIQFYFGGNGFEIDLKYRYEYDSMGNWTKRMLIIDNSEYLVNKRIIEYY
jgi:hypothetical protein